MGQRCPGCCRGEQMSLAGHPLPTRGPRVLWVLNYDRLADTAHRFFQFSS